MPRFSYKAKDTLDTFVEGVIEAEDLDNAAKKIIRSGIAPIEILPQVAPAFSFQWTRKVSLADKAVFFRQLGDLVEAEVPLLKALQLSSKQTKDLAFRQTLEKIYADVEDGRSLSEALLAFPIIFQRMHTNMIQSGEIGGQLSAALTKVAGFIENEREAKRKIGLSLIYPVFICMFSCLVIIVLLTFVIPKIMVMYEDMSESLPLPTIILMAVSNFMIRFWWVLAGLAGLAAVYFRKLNSSREGKLKIDSRILITPFLGDLAKGIEIGRFARVLGSLLDSGVSIISALESAHGALENEALKEEIALVREDVIHGTSLTQALKARSVHWSETEINLIIPGEASGRMAKSFYKLAEICEQEVDVKIKTITVLIEPVIILSVGLIVGFILIAALLPILNMNMIVK